MIVLIGVCFDSSKMRSGCEQLISCVVCSVSFNDLSHISHLLKGYERDIVTVL